MSAHTSGMWFFFSKQVYLRPGHPLLKLWRALGTLALAFVTIICFGVVIKVLLGG